MSGHKARFIARGDWTGWTRVEFAYDPEYIQAIKDTIPSHQRNWDGKSKTWLIHPNYEQALTRAFLWVEACRPTRPGWDGRRTGEGYTGYTPPREPQRQAPTAPKDLEGCLAELFRALPEHLRAPAHKALVKVAHPDVGGDHQVAVALNLAWKQVAA